jgi:hypothetical protein
MIETAKDEMQLRDISDYMFLLLKSADGNVVDEVNDIEVVDKIDVELNTSNESKDDERDEVSVNLFDAVTMAITMRTPSKAI